MRWIIPMFIISLFMFTFIIGPVSAWYENEEFDYYTNRSYDNTDFNDDEMYKIKSIDVFTHDIYVYNLEPGYFMAYNDDIPCVYKYDTDGILQWLEISDLEAKPTYGMQACIDDDYNIYVASGAGVIKLDGTDGSLIWKFNNIVDYDKINIISISQDSHYIYVHTGTNKNCLINADTGALIEDSATTDITNVIAVSWTSQNKLIVATTSNTKLYDLELNEDYEINNTACDYMVYAKIVETIGFNSSTTDIVILNNDDDLNLYYSNASTSNEFEKAWYYDIPTFSVIRSNIIYNEASNSIYFAVTNGTSLPSNLMSINWTYTDTNNVSLNWFSAPIDNNANVDCKLICDKYGDVILQRDDMTSIYIYNDENGAIIQSLSVTRKLYNNGIYDQENQKYVNVDYTDSTHWYIELFQFNSTYVQSDDRHEVIIPDEIDEETWDWILFTFMILCLSAIGAYTAFNGFSQTGFLGFLSINIFIGAWYSIYPIEIIALPMAILAVMIFRSGGDVTE